MEADPGNLPSYETEEQRLRRELAEANAKLERLKRAYNNIKVSGKGAVSLYGLGKYPVTLYADQWRMLLSQADVIEQFIVDHAGQLATKDKED